VLRAALTTAVVAAGLFFLPFSLPVLAEEPMVQYSAFVAHLLHVDQKTMATERHRSAQLPPDWADMHGWPELESQVAAVYRSLPPGERAQATIVASNYGEASAIDFFGKADALPPVISGHNNYFLWGTHGASGKVVIDVNGDCGAAEHLYRNARMAARFDPPWGISYERDVPIMVCTGPTRDLSTIWPSLKHYI